MSQKSNQRLHPKDKAFASIKLNIMDYNFKSEVKRKFPQNDLKHVFWTGVNKQIVNSKHKAQKNIKNEQFYFENQNIFDLDTTQKIQFQNPIQNQSSREKSPSIINSDNFKGFQMTFNKILLPSIVKNGKSHVNLQRILEKDLIQKKPSINLRRTISLDFQNQSLNKPQQNIPTLTRLKSKSVANLKNKIKLQKVRPIKKISDHAQKQQIENGRSSRNQNDLFPQNFNSQSPRNKQKKFHISNLNLNTPENRNEIVTKRNYVLKLLENHDKLLERSQGRKNSLLNLMQRENMSLKRSQMNFYQDDNFIARSITFSHPQQLLLKKIMGKIRKQENEKRPIRKQGQQNNKINVQNFTQKLKKQKINGWDVNKQYEANMLGMGSEEFEEI